MKDYQDMADYEHDQDSSIEDNDDFTGTQPTQKTDRSNRETDQYMVTKKRATYVEGIDDYDTEGDHVAPYYLDIPIYAPEPILDIHMDYYNYRNFSDHEAQAYIDATQIWIKNHKSKEFKWNSSKGLYQKILNVFQSETVQGNMGQSKVDPDLYDERVNYFVKTWLQHKFPEVKRKMNW